MKLIYKPFAIILGLLGGLVGRQVFNQVWQRVDDEEPPEPTTRETGIPRLLAAVALQGAIFALVKMAIQRGGARAWRHLFGIWPGEERPDPK
jgi:xanthosine utilization system XapX-like protein